MALAQLNQAGPQPSPRVGDDRDPAGHRQMPAQRLGVLRRARSDVERSDHVDGPRGERRLRLPGCVGGIVS